MPDSVFSYRVTGILVWSEKVLLQKSPEYENYAAPGGHVLFGETAAEALEREFLEETGAAIRVGRLLAVGEMFFAWDTRPCHQLGLYFAVALAGGSRIPLEGTFTVVDGALDGGQVNQEFTWVPLSKLESIPVYPPQLRNMLRSSSGGVTHFLYREE